MTVCFVVARMSHTGRNCAFDSTLAACHAVAEPARLVTNNLRHFAGVPDLKIEQWSA